MPSEHWAPFVNMGLLILIVAWVAAIAYKARGWSVPVQDAKLIALRRDADTTYARSESNRRDIDAAHAKADAIKRDAEHWRREQTNENDALLKEIRSVGSQVEKLLTLRDEVQNIQGLAAKLEQEVTSLVCFEDAQLRSQALPGFCPLRKIPCPVEGELPVAVVVPTPILVPVHPPKAK